MKRKPDPDGTRARRWRDWRILALATLTVFVVVGGLARTAGGFALTNYLVGTLLLFVLIYALMALGLNLQYGFTGLVNFGHIMFALVGAYTGVLLSRDGTPLGLAVLAALAAGAAIGVLVGGPALRLREDYLAIVTIGAAEILRRIAENEAWLTEGVLGVRSFPRPFLDWSRESPAWTALADFTGVRRYQLLLVVLAALSLALAYLLVERLVRSPWGRVVKAIRDDEDVARALGKNVLAYKLQVLALAGAITALGGLLFVWNTATLYPSHFPHVTTFFLWIVVILGGVANNRGVLLGALLVWGIFETAGQLTILQSLGIRDLTGPPQSIFIGLVLILMMLYRPQGTLGRREELDFAR